MPRTKEQNEAMRIATKEKIHKAAARLFSHKGFAATGVQEIADNAEISVGLLYRHYKTKDEIFGAFVTMALEDLGELGKAFDAGVPAAELIKMFSKEIAADIENNDEFVQFMILLNRPFISKQDLPWMPALLERNRIFEEQLTGLIRRGQAEGSFREGGAKSMAQLFLATVMGLCDLKQGLPQRFAAPSPQMLTAFLLKEEYNNYA